MEHLFAVKYAWLIPLLPLIGAAVSGFLGARWLKDKSHWPIWIGVGCSAILSFSLLFGMLGLWKHVKGERASLAYNRVLFDWITAGNPANKPGDQSFISETRTRLGLSLSRWGEIHVPVYSGSSAGQGVFVWPP